MAHLKALQYVLPAVQQRCAFASAEPLLSDPRGGDERKCACTCTGHGILWDGYRNEDLERLICDFYAADKTVAACSHGAVALLGVQVTFHCICLI